MLRKDFLQRQIEELGKFMRLMIEKIWNRNASNEELEAEMSALNAEFTENCGFDINLLLIEDITIVLEKIKNDPTYNHENVDLLADFMFELAERYPQSAISTQAILRANAYSLYKYADETFKTFSFERQQKMTKLYNYRFTNS